MSKQISKKCSRLPTISQNAFYFSIIFDVIVLKSEIVPCSNAINVLKRTTRNRCTHGIYKSQLATYCFISVITFRVNKNKFISFKCVLLLTLYSLDIQIHSVARKELNFCSSADMK